MSGQIQHLAVYSLIIQIIPDDFKHYFASCSQFYLGKMLVQLCVFRQHLKD